MGEHVYIIHVQMMTVFHLQVIIYYFVGGPAQVTSEKKVRFLVEFSDSIPLYKVHIPMNLISVVQTMGWKVMGCDYLLCKK